VWKEIALKTGKDLDSKLFSLFEYMLGIEGQIKVTALKEKPQIV